MTSYPSPITLVNKTMFEDNVKQYEPTSYPWSFVFGAFPSSVATAA